MKSALFLSRLALLCNAFFLVCLIIRQTHDFIPSADIKATVIILGWLLAPLINLIATTIWGIRLLQRKQPNLAAWLPVTNILFLAVQVFIHFILPA
ncbi:MAG TPA: hypothetical protein VG842_10840 [Sediminibacterium sp.]|nr:hypothetical protein [Sediminibacterium sp.]